MYEDVVLTDDGDVRTGKISGNDVVKHDFVAEFVNVKVNMHVYVWSRKVEGCDG